MLARPIKPIAIAICVLALLTLLPCRAVASHQQVALFEEELHSWSDPAATFQELRHLGVGMVRVEVRWSLFAPDPTSLTKPAFDATDPNAYSSSQLAGLDAIVLNAAANGIQVMMTPSAWAPYWAQGPDPSRYGAHYDIRYSFEPSAAEFAKFVQALGTRYSGTFVPPGASTPLPRISTWEIYNEPNFGESLAPQARYGSRVPVGARFYRDIADDAYAALGATGHGQDTILIGALGADGTWSPATRHRRQGLPGTYGEMPPLSFIRELYCMQPNWHRYLGWDAYLRGCPTTKAGYRNFEAKHPVLFHASGFSDHPYDIPKGLPPTEASSSNPNHAEFSQLPHLQSTLDYIQWLYGSSTKFPIWNTEYGYITCPPNCTKRYASPKNAAAYINWAEYLSWRNPRIASTMQYLLIDPNPTVGVAEKGGFASGLVYFRGTPKDSYNAYRMPLFLPYTKTWPGHALEVWGDVRPAPYAVADGDGPQYAEVQFARSGSSTWTTMKTLPVTDPHGYVDTWITFPANGWVRLQWTYPASDKSLVSTMITNSNGTIGSRYVFVKVSKRRKR
jgi:hypothetical protein